MTVDGSAEATGQRSPVAPLPRLRAPKSSEVLAEKLRERILANEYTTGADLPPERDLIAQTGFGRTTVREALRILEAQGLVKMKARRSGGAVVRQPGEDLMADTVSLLVRGHWMPVTPVLETREAIEPYTARLAALHRSEEDLARLEERTAQLLDPALSFGEYLDAHVEWHVEVARAGGNELLAGLVVGLTRTIRDQVDTTLLDVSRRESAEHAHEQVMQAIRAGDGDAAARRMARHVHAHTEAVRSAPGADRVAAG
jgi:GntR family transcriptional regulator, transcriptional repressor for pyruvate dehydrogenase complex